MKRRLTKETCPPVKPALPAPSFYISQICQRYGQACGPWIKAFPILNQKWRQMIGGFLEIYVKRRLEVGPKRGVNGMYKKAVAGEIPQFTGVSDPYEEPRAPELTLYADHESAEESAGRVLRLLRDTGFI